MRQRGVTLIELMITIAVAAVILTVAVPSFISVINSNRLTSAANELMASLQSARMEAIRNNKRAGVCLSSNANGANPTCVAGGNAAGANGWITYVDMNTNGVYNSGTDTLLRVTTSHKNIKILGSSNVPGAARVVFRSDGFARNNAGTGFLDGAIDLCMETTNPSENVRRVLIGSGGRISITTPDGTNGVCATPANPS